MDTKCFRAFARLVLGLSLVGVLTFGVVGPASAGRTIYVRYGYGGLHNGTSWASAYTDLQAALAAAGAGDQIWVASGTYRPTTTLDRAQTFALKTGVAVYGGFSGSETSLSQRNPTINVTILSGEIGEIGYEGDNSYHVVSAVSVASTAILDGFTVMAGNADGGTGDDRGAGLYNNDADPTLRNIVFSNNTATSGGGMYVAAGSPGLTNVTFVGNSALLGGGLRNVYGSPSLTNVAFNGNLAGIGGGGLLNESSMHLTNVKFVANMATGRGGGLRNSNSSTTLTNVEFVANWGIDGGGMANTSASPTLTNVTFTRNHAANFGGGMYNQESGATIGNATFRENSAWEGAGIYNGAGSNTALTNVTFRGNTAGRDGGGIANSASDPKLQNVTLGANLASNHGGAIHNTSGNPIIKDTIAWGSASPIVVDAGTPVIADSIVQGGCPAGSTCTGVFSADPKLGPLQRNGGATQTMALGGNSAAIDAGGAHSTCAAKDQRGVTRPQGGKCDIGAYEVKAITLKSVGAYDGWALESGENTNAGGSINSAGSTILLGDDGANKQYRGVLSFETSAVPDAATLVLARVKIRRAGMVGMNPFATHGSLTLSLKKPYFGTTVGLQVGDFQAAATVANAGTISSTLVSGWYGGLVNSTARAAVNKTGATQLRLRFTLDDNNDHGADYLSLYSGNATSTYRPLLIVYYNP